MPKRRPVDIFPWLPNSELLNPFYQGICEFVDKYIDLENLNTSTKTKEIIDPCVGYIKVYSWEMALLDTLLFQRLRKITQLGLAYLVYPTLSYSRFEHTIGVLGRLNQVLTRLKERHATNESKENDGSFINIIDNYEAYVRLAALFHDVGHCLFSHLSESVIDQLKGSSEYPSTEEIKRIFNEKFSLKNTNLSIFEIFTITILATHKVAEVLVRSNIKFNLKKDEKNITKFGDLQDELHKVAMLIAGLPLMDKPDTVFLAQLMNSGLDVDKLDYMSREELFSGIKIEMDLQRIFNKIKLVKINPRSLPNPLKKYTKHLKPSTEHSFIVLGIEKGGQFSYEEFCMARLALYEKIYLHKKVRAAESFLKQKLHKLAINKSSYNHAHEWLYLPESIIEKGIFIKIKDKLIRQDELFPIELEISENIKLEDIKDRKIPNRAFGFGPANSKTDDPTKNEKGDILSEDELSEIKSVNLWNNLRQEENKYALIEAIIEEGKFLSKSIKEIDTIHIEEQIRIIENIRDEDIIRDTLVIDIPNYEKVQIDPQTLHFEDAGYQTINWTIPIDRISSYYKLHRILAYIHVFKDFCPLIFLAVERVLYNFNNEKYIFDQNHAISKETYLKADRIKYFLIEKSHYNNYKDLIPLSNELNTGYVKEIINQIIQNLGGLECLEDRRLSYLDVEKFIRQFPQDLQLPVLHLINCIRVLDYKKELSPLISDISNRISSSSESKIGILPLGSYLNSSSNLLKSIKKTIKENDVEELTINSNLKDVTHVLFIDDNINTGIQCLNIMSRLLRSNLELLKNDKIILDLKSKGEVEYPNELFSAELIKKKLIFIFISGHESSENELRRMLIKYCGLSEKRIEIHIINRLLDTDRLFSGKYTKGNDSIFRKIRESFYDSCSIEQGEKLSEYLRNVGAELVNNEGIIKLYKQDPKNHSLGYSNRESLTIFANSIPTMTITALWCYGEYFGNEWIPLIPRDYRLKFKK